MKILILHILLIIGALLLIGSKATAQNNNLTKYSDRDWIDSLAVAYRVDYIESVMLKDEATFDKCYSVVSMLILKGYDSRRFGRSSNEELDLAIRDYAHEGLARKLRRRSFEKEIRSAQTEFNYTPGQ